MDNLCLLELLNIVVVGTITKRHFIDYIRSLDLATTLIFDIFERFQDYIAFIQQLYCHRHAITRISTCVYLEDNCINHFVLPSIVDSTITQYKHRSIQLYRCLNLHHLLHLLPNLPLRLLPRRIVRPSGPEFLFRAYNPSGLRTRQAGGILGIRDTTFTQTLGDRRRAMQPQRLDVVPLHVQVVDPPDSLGKHIRKSRDAPSGAHSQTADQEIRLSAVDGKLRGIKHTRETGDFPNGRTRQFRPHDRRVFSR